MWKKFNRQIILKKKVTPGGLEPPAHTLKVYCSTN